MTITKKIGLTAVMLLLTWLAIEALGFGAYFFITHSLYSKNKIKDEIRSNIDKQGVLQVGQGGLKWGQFVEVLHPYFGYVADPNRNEGISDFGFLASKGINPIEKRTDDKLIVGVFGGSFAAQLYMLSGPVLNECLKLSNRDILLLNFAAGGYKQPQQLLILNYFLSLGAEFDAIINIDGFNEIALPVSDNLPNDVNPFFPRAWHLRVATVIDPVQIQQIGQLKLLESKKASWARLFNNHKLYRSPTMALIWQLRDRILNKEIYETRLLINNADANKGSVGAANYAATGPRYSYSSDVELYADLVDMWRRTSLQMSLIARANGTAYYHFLQPNQYLPDSKPMGAEERKIALRDDNPYRQATENGYPLLQKAGEALGQAGVDFTDLTLIFSEITEPLYADSCCHLNRRGYDIVASRICDHITGAKAELHKDR